MVDGIFFWELIAVLFIICIMTSNTTGTLRHFVIWSSARESEYELQLISCKETDCCSSSGELM